MARFVSTMKTLLIFRYSQGFHHAEKFVTPHLARARRLTTTVTEQTRMFSPTTKTTQSIHLV